MVEEDFKKKFGTTLAVRKSALFAYFGDFEAGAEDALERGESFAKEYLGSLYGFEPFFRGISLYAMARKTNLPKYKIAAKKAQSRIKNLVKKGCINLIPTLRLLEAEAERTAIFGKGKRARDKYEEAISIASKSEFHNIAALASERYAEYLIEDYDISEAKNAMRLSIDKYTKWGASSLVEMMQQRLQNILLTSN